MRSISLIPLLSLVGACVLGETRTVPAYQAVDNYTDAKVMLSASDTSGSPTSVRVNCLGGQDGKILLEGDESQILLGGNVRSTLVIKAEDGFDASGCEIGVPSMNIDTITVRGDGDLESDDVFSALTALDLRGNGTAQLAEIDADALDLSVSGDGDVNVDALHVGSVDFELGGNGTTTVAGDASEATLDMTGNAIFKGADFAIDTLTADVSGNATAIVDVTGAASIAVSGTASVIVDGGGSVKQDVSGDGSVSIASD